MLWPHGLGILPYEPILRSHGAFPRMSSTTAAELHDDPRAGMDGLVADATDRLTDVLRHPANSPSAVFSTKRL